MKKLFLVLALLCATTLSARVIIFDIHGVILKENLSEFISQKIKSALSKKSRRDAHNMRALPSYHSACDQLWHVAQLFSGDLSVARGIHDNPLYLQLCSLMKKDKPLGEPGTIPAGVPLPWEVYALFCGHHTPEETHPALSNMVATADISDLDRLMLSTLVDAIFDRANFTQTMTPVPATKKLMEVLMKNPAHQVYIYSNAPAPWVDHYSDIFPDTFLMQPMTITSSGHTGQLKPLKASFQAVADMATCTLPEMFLIDDTGHNVKGAQAFGLQAHQYVPHDLVNFKELTAILVSESIIDAATDRKSVV